MATENDAFCLLEDVSRRVPDGAFTADSTPTAEGVLEFMAEQAAQLQARLVGLGAPYTVPSGSNPVTAGTPLAYLLRAANADLAAAEVIEARDALNDPDPPPAAERRRARAFIALESIELLIAESIVPPSYTHRDYPLDGGTRNYDNLREGIIFDRDTRF